MISRRKEAELSALSGLFDTTNVEWAIFAKTNENADAWYAYVFEVLEGVEGADSLKDILHDMPEIGVASLILDLCKLGAKIDSSAPMNIWENADDYEMTPLASAIREILQAWGELRDWIDDTLVFDDVPENDYELFDAIGDLEWLVSDLALEHADRSLLYKIGIEEGKLDTAIKEGRSKIESRLHDVCTLRTKYGLPITEDYFQLLYLPSFELAEQYLFRPGTRHRIDEDSIKEYLPYGERMILTHLECTAEALQVLNKKLDQILKKRRGASKRGEDSVGSPPS